MTHTLTGYRKLIIAVLVASVTQELIGGQANSETNYSVHHSYGDAIESPLLKSALREIGVSESGAPQHRNRVLKYLRSLNPDASSTKTPWCSAFLYFVASQNGFKDLNVDLTARSWLRVGETVVVPARGDIMVFSRGDPNSWTGHVGLYISETDSNYLVLGGNQGDMVSIAPFDKKRLIGIRRF